MLTHRSIKKQVAHYYKESLSLQGKSPTDTHIKQVCMRVMQGKLGHLPPFSFNWLVIITKYKELNNRSFCMLSERPSSLPCGVFDVAPAVRSARCCSDGIKGPCVTHFVLRHRAAGPASSQPEKA